MPEEEKDIYDYEHFELNRGTILNWKGLIGWIPAFAGLGVCVYNYLAVPPIDNIFLNLLAFLGVTAVCVVLHELGHFFAGRWLGLNPLCLEVGSGDVVVDHEFKRFRLILRISPYCGAVFPVCFEAGRLAQFIMVAAGPATNAVLALLGYALVSADPANWSPHHTEYNTFSVVLLLANLYLLAISLYPQNVAIGSMSTASDGLSLWYLLTNQNPEPQILAESGEKTALPSWRLMVETQAPDTLLKLFRESLQLPDLTDQDRLVSLDGFATTVLMYGCLEHLAEADKYSLELVHLAPDSCTAKGTRGGILVETGQLDSGIEMLGQVYEKSSSELDKAICASFLALAEHRKGHLTKAREWIAISRKIDPNCASMIRIEKTLQEIQNG